MNKIKNLIKDLNIKLRDRFFLIVLSAVVIPIAVLFLLIFWITRNEVYEVLYKIVIALFWWTNIRLHKKSIQTISIVVAISWTLNIFTDSVGVIVFSFLSSLLLIFLPEDDDDDSNGGIKTKVRYFKPEFQMNPKLI